jgi:putative transcriptional regulator
MAIRVRPTDLLIAPPACLDARFKNSVMMMTHDNPRGSFAVCVNKPTKYTLDQLLEDSDLDVGYIPSLPVYWGGPMNAKSIWMIHSADWVCEETVMLTSVWAMTSSMEMFHNIAAGDYPKQFRIIMGYAAWSPGQLNAELEGHMPWKKENSWLVANNPGPEWLFDLEDDALWTSMITLSSHQAVDSWL